MVGTELRMDATERRKAVRSVPPKGQKAASAEREVSVLCGVAGSRRVRHGIRLRIAEGIGRAAGPLKDVVRLGTTEGIERAASLLEEALDRLPQVGDRSPD